MSSEIAIEVQNVSKSYAIWSSPAARLHGPVLGQIGQLPFLPEQWRERCRQVSHESFRNFFALQDVSFEVRRGEGVGIIGRNGAGKSTLLQIIVGTLRPTAGQVTVSGRVAALLELGAGFNPEFTGRENVFLNAAILGFSRQQTEARFEEIAAFADIGDFIDQPVKTYSSGMLVRLAFAVQVQVEPEILVVDEALSVGDMFFQAKCMARIEQMRRRGVTVLFVSHGLQTVKTLCDRALLLEKGRVTAWGDVESVADVYSVTSLYERPASAPAADAAGREVVKVSSDYRSTMQPPFAERITERTGKGDAQYYECAVFQDDQEVNILTHGKECVVVAWLEHHTELDVTAEVGIVVRNLDGLELFAINSYFLKTPYRPQPKGTRTRIAFRFVVTLAPGIYSVVLGLRVPLQGEYWDKVFNSAVFRVVTKAGEYVPGMFSQSGRIEYASL